MRNGTVAKVAAVAVITSMALAMPMAASDVKQMHLFGDTQVYAAVKDVQVYLDASLLAFPDTQPLIKDGRTLVPVRGVFEAMGYQVDWNEGSQTVTLTSDGATIKIKVGEPSFDVSGKNVALDVPAQLINGRTMLPLRAISEATGANVTWEDASRTVSISTTGKPIAPPTDNQKPAENQQPTDNVENVMYEGYVVNKVGVGNGLFIYHGDTKASVEARLGTDCTKESASDYDDTMFMYRYVDLGVTIHYDESNRVCEVFLKKPGLSHMGYTIGDPFSPDQPLRSYERVNPGMGYVWNSIIGTIRINDKLYSKCDVMGNTGLTTEPKPTSIGAIAVDFYY